MQKLIIRRIPSVDYVVREMKKRKELHDNRMQQTCAKEIQEYVRLGGKRDPQRIKKEKRHKSRYIFTIVHIAF